MTTSARYVVWQLDAYNMLSLMKILSSWEEAVSAKDTLIRERDAYSEPDDATSYSNNSGFEYNIRITDMKGFLMSTRTSKRKRSKKDPTKLRRRFVENIEEHLECIPVCDQHNSGFSLAFYIENCCSPQYAEQLKEHLYNTFDGDLTMLKKLYSGGDYDSYD